MKISKKQGALLFTILVSVSMTAVMSFGISLIRIGWQEHTIKMWFGDFLVGCCLSIPTGLTIVPLLKKSIDKITEK